MHVAIKKKAIIGLRNNEPTWLKGFVRFTNFHGVIAKGDVSIGKI